MKKFFLIILVILILAIAGGAVFLLTFNADQYRPMITDQLQKALGKPVKIERIGFAWRSGIALSLRGLVIADDPGFRDELIRVESANALLNLAPLLNHEVQISSVYINEPKISVVRKKDGSLLGFESKPRPDESKTSKTAKGGSPANAAAALSFLVDQVRIDSGEFIFTDQSDSRVTVTHLKDIDLKIDNAALDQPIDLELKAAFLSSRQNVNITGQGKFLSRSHQAVLENFKGEVDLDSIDLAEVSRLAPETASSGLEQLSGKIQIETGGRIILDEKAIQTASAVLSLNDGEVRLAQLPTPIDNITFNAALQTGLIKIQKVSADFAGGNIGAQGQVNLKTPKPLTALTVNLRNLSLSALAPPASDLSQPKIEGVLSGGFEGTMTGISAAEIQRSLSGEGKLLIDRGVVRNLNILREVFRKLSMIPGLIENLRRRLPENYQEKLNERDTVFEPVQIPFSAKDGVLVFNRLELQTDSFALQGGGSYGMAAGVIGAQTNLYVEPELSAALIQSVNELQYLADRKSGALMIPINIQGRIPEIAVVPDLQYIASRLAVAKTQDVLGSLLNPKRQTVDPATGQSVSQSAQSPAAEQSSGEQTSTGKTKYPKGSQILGALLQSAMQPQSSSDSSANSQQGSSYY